jgi:hypothetical protein
MNVPQEFNLDKKKKTTRMNPDRFVNKNKKPNKSTGKKM